MLSKTTSDLRRSSASPSSSCAEGGLLKAAPMTLEALHCQTQSSGQLQTQLSPCSVEPNGESGPECLLDPWDWSFTAWNQSRDGCRTPRTAGGTLTSLACSWLAASVTDWKPESLCRNCWGQAHFNLLVVSGKEDFADLSSITSSIRSKTQNLRGSRKSRSKNRRQERTRRLRMLHSAASAASFLSLLFSPICPCLLFSRRSRLCSLFSVFFFKLLFLPLQRRSSSENATKKRDFM